MTFADIHIRDPFVLACGDTFYLYGTRGSESWGESASGLDVYVSNDLVDWSEAKECFTPPANFWATKNFWAPEVHEYRSKYYMFVSFKSDARCRGTQILRADSPLGPFVPHSDGPVTPEQWECLDGTLYVDKSGKPYIVFCHEWVQVRDGEMCALPLSDDLSAPAGNAFLLFRASEPSWARKNAESYVTDGPFMFRTKAGTLLMIWSSFTDKGYCEAVSYSDNGEITGKWLHRDKLLFEKDGGHGMIFDLNGELNFIFHSPNKHPGERPHTVKIADAGDTLTAK